MDMAGIFARESAYLGRYVQVGVASGRVISVSFPEAPDPDAPENHDPAPLLIADHRVRDGPSAAPPEIEQRLRSLEGL